MIHLHTPAPPARTGTAAYAGRLLRELRRLGAPPEALRVVTEAPGGPCEGFARIEGAAWPRVAAPGEIHVFFLANNAAHIPVHAALRELRRIPPPNGGAPARAIAVIHEPCCWMALNLAAGRGLGGFSTAALTAGLEDQYGPAGGRMLEDFRAGRAAPAFEYVTHMLGHALRGADEIWTHSRFAALKLILESRIPAAALPRFRVFDHPPPEHLRAEHLRAEHLRAECFGAECFGAGAAPRRAVFTVGLFGHVTRPKRVREAVRAFYRASCRVEPDELPLLRMLVAGEIPDPGRYDPRADAAELGVADRVDFVGRLDDDGFVAGMAACGLILNLRHPSNGETSGTLIEARALGVATVTSDCQAMREGGATARVPTPPGDEVEACARAIGAAFAAWRGRRKTGAAPPPGKDAAQDGAEDGAQDGAPPPAPLAAMIAAMARRGWRNGSRGAPWVD
ncbi:glycosyltransferase [Rubrimonas cliftonensis]|uniref:Glycosyltransferase involved in cell wall bisynthesis n=1 Tax=Rubrimonas cliftonensis TaxID=89524 RepID=A0A1H4CY20_9RHOB|nr:glycosyltransferase [Rubrimonas cliftonensis]SEA65271.1 Glycosyltransferase involved in cell wall bisynthesis [Rubrimonas cliftonensis]